MTAAAERTIANSRWTLLLVCLAFMSLSAGQYLYRSAKSGFAEMNNRGDHKLLCNDTLHEEPGIAAGANESSLRCNEPIVVTAMDDSTSTPAASAPVAAESMRPSLVLCLSAEFYGNNFNRIVTVANALAAARNYTATSRAATMSLSSRRKKTAGRSSLYYQVGLSANWSGWYESLLDYPDMGDKTVSATNARETMLPLLLNYSGACLEDLDPMATYFRHGYDFAGSNMLHVFLPKLEYRTEAQNILDAMRVEAATVADTATLGDKHINASSAPRRSLQRSFKTTIVSVHRRNLDFECERVARTNEYSMCDDTATFANTSTEEDRLNICFLTYDMIQHDLSRMDNSTHYSVLLLTDGQVPEGDNTFTRIANYAFGVEACCQIYITAVPFLPSTWSCVYGERLGNNNTAEQLVNAREV